VGCRTCDVQSDYTARSLPQLQQWHRASYTPEEKGKRIYTKTLDLITEIIRNPKHPFRKADDRPVKAQKHRYERRKIKEIIRLGDWGAEGTT